MTPGAAGKNHKYRLKLSFTGWRGLPAPAPPALTDIRNALETGADSVLSACIAEGTPMRWAPLAEKLGGPDLEERHRIEAVLNCLMETI